MNRRKNLRDISKDMAGIPLIAIQYSQCLPYVERGQVNCSLDANKILRPYFEMQGIETYEAMYALFLSRAKRTNGVGLISIGSISGTIVSIQKICQMALLSHSTSVVLAHNHPSGNLTPSAPDEHLTRRVQDALKLIECQLIDHIIITTEGYYSFADEGKI
jgi:DNA repair protein RadC